LGIAYLEFAQRERLVDSLNSLPDGFTMNDAVAFSAGIPLSVPSWLQRASLCGLLFRPCERTLLQIFQDLLIHGVCAICEANKQQTSVFIPLRMCQSGRFMKSRNSVFQIQPLQSIRHSALAQGIRLILSGFGCSQHVRPPK